MTTPGGTYGKWTGATGGRYRLAGADPGVDLRTVQDAGRLVEQDKIGIGQQRFDDLDLLAGTDREVGHRAVVSTESPNSSAVRPSRSVSAEVRSRSPRPPSSRFSPTVIVETREKCWCTMAGRRTDPAVDQIAQRGLPGLLYDAVAAGDRERAAQIAFDHITSGREDSIALARTWTTETVDPIAATRSRGADAASSG